MAFFEKIHFSAEQKFIVLAAFLYSLMHVGIFFISDAVYFDDWVVVDSSSETILNIFQQAGAMFNLVGYLHVGFVSMGVWSYKFLTFVLMAVAGLFLNEVLKRNGTFGCQTRWCVILLFLLLPFNMARVPLIDFPYTACYVMFFGAWLAIDRYRVLSAILFFLSFNTNSLLVFYVLPILDLWYRSSERHSLSTLIKVALARWELMVIPFLFFGAKFMFYRPEGFYAGYNQSYSLKVIPSMVAAQIRDIFDLHFNSSVVLALFPLVFFLLWKLFSSNGKKQNTLSHLWYLALGGMASVLACLPYWILGYTPTFSDWTSRYQLLMPLGAALLVSAGLMLLPKFFKVISLSIVLSACISYGVSGYYHFYIDWQKQLILLDEFRKDPVVSEANLILIKDRTKDLGAFGRTYRFYEWNGLLARALGDDRRFGLELGEVSKYAKGDFDKFFVTQYKSGKHVRSAEEAVAIVQLDLKAEDGEGLWSRLAPKIAYKSRILSKKNGWI